MLFFNYIIISNLRKAIKVKRSLSYSDDLTKVGLYNIKIKIIIFIRRTDCIDCTYIVSVTVVCIDIVCGGERRSKMYGCQGECDKI